jgi:hypothetical protein
MSWYGVRRLEGAWEGRRNSYILFGKRNAGDLWEDLDIDSKAVLYWNIKQEAGGFTWLGIGSNSNFAMNRWSP